MGRRRIEIKKIPNKTARKITFKKRTEGIFKKAYELSVLTGCRVSLSIIESEQGAEYVFDPAKPQPSKNTNRAIEPRQKSQEAMLAVEEALPAALTLPEASSSSLAVLEPSKGCKLGTPDAQSFETLSWNFDGSMDLLPLTDLTGMPTWEETLVKDCIDVAGPLQSMLVPPSSFTPPCFTDPYGFSLYPPLHYLPNDFGWLTESPMQMPLLF
jgi:hypothetical protein